MLISVTDLNGNTEPLNNYQRPEIIEEVNGAFTLAVTSFFVDNNPGHVLLEEESVINVQGYNFRIKQMRSGNNTKELVALSTFFDLTGHRQELIYGGTRTMTEFLTFIFGDTGWTFSTDIVEEKFIPNFGENNVIELITDLTAVFECEYQIMPNEHVHFAKEVGGDNDAQYRYGHNVNAFSIDVETYNLRTQITGTRPRADAVLGEDDVVEVPAHEGFKVTYTSPFAEKYGIKNRVADPIINDEIRTEEEMVDYLKSELVDYPEVSIELEAIELTEKNIGEKVWLIYEPIKLADGTFMEFQTRVMQKTSTIRDGEIVTDSIIVGNIIPRTLSDIVNEAEVEISKNAKWTRSRIEQTNTMIELAVERFTGEMLEAYAFIKITADEILSEVGAIDVRLTDGVAQNKSSISQTATQIRSEVSSEIKRVDGTLTSLSSSITQTATSIRSEVNQSVTRLDGRIDTANSSITQTATQIRTELGSVKTELDGKITTANTTISTLAGQISAKADSTVVTALGSRINTVEYDMNAVEGKISSKVSLVDISGSFIWSRIDQTASSVRIQAKNIELEGIVRVADSIDLGHSGSGGTKAIKFNGYNAWIYSSGDFSLTLDSSYVNVLGELNSYSPYSGRNMPVISGTTAGQRLSIGLTTNGTLNVYRPNGTVASFSPD